MPCELFNLNNPDILPAKLEAVGTAFYWFKSYLKDKIQQI